MNFISTLLLILLSIILFAALIVLIFLAIFPLKAAVSFNSELQQDFHLILTWISPLFKAVIHKNEDENLITIYLFNKRTFTRNLKIQKEQHTNFVDLIKTIRPAHIMLRSSYGFQDPSVTGMVCGAFDMLSQYMELEYLYNNPDFYTAYDYFSINAEAEIHLLSSLSGIIKAKKLHFPMNLVHGNK
jgi:hypothetical protein